MYEDVISVKVVDHKRRCDCAGAVLIVQSQAKDKKRKHKDILVSNKKRIKEKVV